MSQFTPNPAIPGLIDQATEALVEAVAVDLMGNTVQNLSLKFHEIYTKTPAAIGEPPAQIRGELAGSVNIKATGQASWEMRVDAAYAHVQEFGGQIFAHRGLVVPVGTLGQQFMAIAQAAGFANAVHQMGLFPLAQRRITNPACKAVYCLAAARPQITPVVAIMASIRVPERPYVRPAMDKTVQDFPALAQTVWGRFFP